MIKRECVDEEGWIDEASFKKLLAVYQILPGPEAHELCVYFGRLRGGKLGGFLAGLGFMLPGFILMLGLSILYVEANLAGHLARPLLRADGGGRGAGRPRPGPAQQILHHRRAAGGHRRRRLRPDRSGSASPSSWSCSAAASPTSCGRTARRWTRPGQLASRSARWRVLAVAAGAITVSLTATIFFEGLKAGLLTFGGAYTVIPFLREARRRKPPLADRAASSSTAWRSAASCRRR